MRLRWLQVLTKVSSKANSEFRLWFWSSNFLTRFERDWRHITDSFLMTFSDRKNVEVSSLVRSAEWLILKSWSSCESFKSLPNQFEWKFPTTLMMIMIITKVALQLFQIFLNVVYLDKVSVIQGPISIWVSILSTLIKNKTEIVF